MKKTEKTKSEGIALGATGPCAAKKRTSLPAFGLLGLALLVGGACTPDQDAGGTTGLTPGSLTVQQTQWNGKQVPVGQIAAAVDAGDQTVIFGSLGVMVFQSGILLASDPTVLSWASATTIPAGDLSGDWIAGVDKTGHVWRLRNNSIMEDVTDRYGLLGAPVRDLASLGKGLTGFALDKLFAVADGMNVSRFDGTFIGQDAGTAGLAGGGGRAASVGTDKVRVLDPQSGKVQEFPVPGAVAAGFDMSGKLIAAAQSGIYAEGDDAELHKVFDSPDVAFSDLAVSGTGTWVAMGDSLALVQGGQILRGPTGLLKPGSKLLGSPSGDVWVVAGGQLTRYGQDSGGGADEQQWKSTILPIFTRVCSLCHLPGGTSGIDLSTYASWTKRRALTAMRVLDGKPTPMPPAGAGTLTSDELDAIRAWTSNTGM